MMKKYGKSNRSERILRLELLESREMLAAVLENGAWYQTFDSSIGNGISGQEQELLEWVNQMRQDPQVTFDRIIEKADPEQSPKDKNGFWSSDYFSTYDSQVRDACYTWDPKFSVPENLQQFLSEWSALQATDPVAFSEILQSTASSWTSTMKNDGTVSHNDNLQEDAGDSYSSVGENVTKASASPYFSIASFVHSSFAIDWGNEEPNHRNTIMNSSFTEVGISMQTDSFSGWYTTCDYGQTSSSDGAWLLGVLYRNISGNNSSKYYEAGEGVGNATITIKQLNGEGNEITINSWTAGGYQIYLKNGTYSITVTGGTNGFATSSITKTATINGSNVKVDFLVEEVGTAAPLVDAGGGEALEHNAAFTWTEGDGSTLCVKDLSITDSDSTYIYQAKVRLEGRMDGVAEFFNIGNYTGFNYDIIYTDPDSMIICGKGTVSQYQDLLRQLTWYDTLDECTLSPRTIYITVSDGNFWSSEVHVTIKVNPAPIELTIESHSVFEGDGSSEIVYTAVLAKAPRTTVSFNYATSDGTAIGGEDNFPYIGGTITFNPGEELKQTFTIPYIGNYTAQLGGNASIYTPANDLYFNIDISNLNGLVLKNNKVTATLIDDDTPHFVIDDNSWGAGSTWTDTTQRNFQTDYGFKRYLYAVTPVSSGLVSFAVESGIPAGFTLTVYEDKYSETSLANTAIRATEKGESIEWSATAGKKYIVCLESKGIGYSTEFTRVSIRVLALEADNVIQVDPLWANLEPEERILNVEMVGEQLLFAIGGNQWTLGQANYHFQTEMGGRIDFMIPGMDASVSSSEYGETLSTGDTDLSFDGFSTIAIAGSNLQEKVNFVGSDGNDALVYYNGTGTFTTHVGESGFERTWHFYDITEISFNAHGGNDTAVIRDSKQDDTANLEENLIDVYGGGHHLQITNFESVDLAFANGGDNNTVQLKPQESDTSIQLSVGNTIMSGIRATSSFQYQIRLYSNLYIEPLEMLDQLLVIGSDTVDTTYDVSIGSLVMNNMKARVTVQAYNIREICIYGLYQTSAEDRKVEFTSDSDCSDPIQEDTMVVVEKEVGERKWALVMPLIWTNYLKECVDKSKEDSVEASMVPSSIPIDCNIWNTALEEVIEEKTTTDTENYIHDLFIPEEDMNSSHGRKNRIFALEIDLSLFS